MDPTINLPPLNIRSILERYGLQSKKSLGQNFLTDPSALEKIVEAAEIIPGEEVLEIGPGLGSLTRYLAQVARQVIAVELDSKLFEALNEVLAPWQNVKIIHGDILKLNPAALMEAAGYPVVANIPYYITSAVIRHLLESKARPSRLVLTVQREVAERICAQPGDLSLLALSVQVYGKPSRVARIPAGAFYPAPKVDSTIVKVEIYPSPVIPENSLEEGFRLMKAGFSQRRKTLRNALSGGLNMPAASAEQMLIEAGINPQRRAETVDLPEWRTLAQIYQQRQSISG